MAQNNYYLAPSASLFLAKFAPEIEQSGYNGCLIENTPVVRNALARALEVARHRGVRSSLRAALRRFDAEAVPSVAKPATKVWIMWKRKGCRTWKAQGTATAEGSMGNGKAMVRSVADGRGKCVIVEAPSADVARARIKAYEDGRWNPSVTAGIDLDDCILGLGLLGSHAVMALARADDQWRGTGAMLEPSVVAELRARRAADRAASKGGN